MRIKLPMIVVVFLAMGICSISNVFAQTFHTEAGAIVTDESILSPGRKQIVFVVAKDILEQVKMEFSTYSNEGQINKFTPVTFTNGLRRGQIIQLFNGELNIFNSTAWLYFWVQIFSTSGNYFCQTMLPVGFREQYKEPMITSITETGGYTEPYQILVRGIFDTTIPSLILINTNMFVSPKTVTQTAPGMIKFNLEPNNFSQFPSGKFLLTICQERRCDTLQGRHR